MTMPRTIRVELTLYVDEDEDDVSDDLIMRDIFENIEGIGYRIITESEDTHE